MTPPTEPPAMLRLADGNDVPHAIGQEVYNYYDMEAGVIEDLATRSEPDTSGNLPGGLAWWVGVRHADGHRALLDGSRLITVETARKKGWPT